MEQPEEPDTESEPEGLRGLRLPEQRGVIETEFLQCFSEFFVVISVGREQTGEHHRLGLGVTLEGLGCR